ncbi:YbbR-like domain-containing protein [Thalassorhabdus alkalitolerans]|uniref:YbbR-like domain-containing protein n=1 Tax=Thalassorhabdus alkalitolerans TaxID=2282697 RepID=A0ABW0YNB9_9BACI
MDKLFNNHWFIKFISLMIAVMLYTMVNMENVNNQPGALPTVNETTHMIEDVEIEAYYDDEQYAIVEIAETVDITLTGPQSSITMFLVNPNYEVYVDLEDRGEGIHHVNIQHSGFPAELAVSIVPQNIQVELQERETVSLPVEVELQNTEGVEDGYTLGAPQVSPSEVEVTAPRAVLNQISAVRTFIDVAGTNERVETTGTVAVYDEFGNELNVEVNPETVDVEIPVTSPFVSVPVNLTREGSLEEGLTIVDLELEPTEVTIFGPQEVIDDIQVVEGVVLDLSAITESQTLELEVEPPPGVEEVRPNTVTVTIEVADEEEATIEDVPIEIEEGEDGDTIEITDPEEETTDVDVYGSENELEAIEEEDIRIIGEVEEGEDGEQTVPLEGEGPEEITVEPEVEEAEVEISEEEEEQDNNDEEENGNDNDDETEE